MRKHEQGIFGNIQQQRKFHDNLTNRRSDVDFKNPLVVGQRDLYTDQNDRWSKFDMRKGKDSGRSARSTSWPLHCKLASHLLWANGQTARMICPPVASSLIHPMWTQRADWFADSKWHDRNTVFITYVWLYDVTNHLFNVGIGWDRQKTQPLNIWYLNAITILVKDDLIRNSGGDFIIRTCGFQRGSSGTMGSSNPSSCCDGMATSEMSISRRLGDGMRSHLESLAHDSRPLHQLGRDDPQPKPVSCH